jgi:predicted RNA binding protein YcfA (HicA-like mRNA interferase family)
LSNLFSKKRFWMAKKQYIKMTAADGWIVVGNKGS